MSIFTNDEPCVPVSENVTLFNDIAWLMKLLMLCLRSQRRIVSAMLITHLTFNDIILDKPTDCWDKMSSCFVGLYSKKKLNCSCFLIINA